MFEAGLAAARRMIGARTPKTLSWAAAIAGASLLSCGAWGAGALRIARATGMGPLRRALSAPLGAVWC